MPVFTIETVSRWSIWQLRMKVSPAMTRHMGDFPRLLPPAGKLAAQAIASEMVPDLILRTVCGLLQKNGKHPAQVALRYVYLRSEWLAASESASARHHPRLQAS
eukprot:4761906-Pleurochrysis_carterae.AAC.8